MGLLSIARKILGVKDEDRHARPTPKENAVSGMLRTLEKLESARKLPDEQTILATQVEIEKQLETK